MESELPYTKLIVRDLRIDMSIGVYDYEKLKAQPVVVNIEAQVPLYRDSDDDIANVVSYEGLVKAAQLLAAQTHFNLVETYAEELAALCFSKFPLLDIRLRVEKPNIIPDAVVGVEIFRKRLL